MDQVPTEIWQLLAMQFLSATDVARLASTSKSFHSRLIVAEHHSLAINPFHSNNSSYLLQAAKHSSVDVVKALIRRGHRLDDPPLTLINAVIGGNEDTARFLLSKGADPNVSFTREEDNVHFNALSEAVAQNHKSILILLLESGATPNKYLQNNTSPLEIACRLGQVDMVRLFIKYNADLNIRLGDRTPITAACENGHLDILELLLEHGANLRDAGHIGMCFALNKGFNNIVRELIRNGIADNSLLNKAVEYGNQEAVELFLDNGVNIDPSKSVIRSMRDPRSALMIACDNDDMSMAKYLLENGADIDWPGTGQTAFIRTCQAGNVELVQLLLSKGANINHVVSGDHEYTALSLACEEGIVKVAKVLLENGANFLWETSYDLDIYEVAEVNNHLDICDLIAARKAEIACSKEFRLLKAVSNSDFKAVEALIKEGANVNYLSVDGNTALLTACSGGNTRMVEFLVHSGAQIASQGHDGNDPFAAACWKNHHDTVCFLLKHGISNLNERKYNGESCLFGACWLGNLEIAEILIRYGADVNTVESRGYSSLDSALTRAAFRGFADIVKLLLANGADVHQTNRDGLTALIKGSECCFNFNFSCGHLETVKMLIEAGSDVNKVGTYGHTALFMACSRGNTHIVNLLIQNGAAADTLHRGSTALMKACGVYLCEYELKHLETVKALIDHGVDVNAVGLNGTALTEATRLNCYEIVKFLVSEGADVNLANGNGDTPLMIASQKNLMNASKKNNMKIMKFLVDVGAVASIHATKGRR